jgi:hypothetical protein
LTFRVPSVSVVLAAPSCPFTGTFSERSGVSVSAFGSVAGSEPGTSTTSAW